MKFSFSLVIYYVFASLAFQIPSATAADTLAANNTLKDGQTLVSSGQRFEFGFFSLGSSSRRYLGIWYKNINPLTVVWVANRDDPITSSSGSLVFNPQGALSLSNGTVFIWFVNVTRALSNPVLQLLDNGNLVLTGDGGDYLWQSFDYLTDTLLPGMKLGWNLKTGLKRDMTSWLSSDDPATGEFTFSLDPPEAPELVLRKGDQKEYRWGPWDGVRFSGSNELRPNPVYTPEFNSSREEIYYTFKVDDSSILSRFIVTSQGLLQYLTWTNHSNEWALMVTLQRDSCDRYESCGPYGNCYADDPNCRCLRGFTPKSPESWRLIDWSDGCVRKRGLDCQNGDGFVKYDRMKLPDNSHLVTNRNFSLSLEECEAECLKNCSCMAYTKIDIHGNGGDCVMWFGDLVDMKYFPNGGSNLYIRMAQAELESIADAKRKKRVKVAALITMSIVLGMLLGVLVWRIYLTRKAKIRRAAISENNSYRDTNDETQEGDLELPLFGLDVVSAATNKFSFEKKIGEGGFGPVYKGVLPTGQEVAVKRLSQNSGQGLREFKNEVILISKLQHRNLVKLLGCCIQGEERMLIYEYQPNKSLDQFLFDKTRRKFLTWKKRFDIVIGIARGLLYLHQDSRLRIIHRDLKASNILLDGEMNPKISDFGIARIFGEKTQEMTKRVIGTYGYMSPEYAMGGHFSVKSDVFSYGVLVLEIVSGKKNWGFYHPDHDLNLVGHTWKLWNEGNPLELMDELMEDTISENEVVRCIQVGLLCVQQRMEDRPTMSSVLLMLSNESIMVPQPKEPGFCTEISSGGDTSSSVNNLHTANELTVTDLGGR
ncbi:PREDICTED: G-type lectin S-receptor-like serine/threonine-protein kinase At4g27290 isoform X1 [Theobroma cacao]|uniref:Receptor-like serine/threonine-protein kinase n=1 Tax=Theobroma cacao TaxID=3641 RepID=A0AB32V1U0_THECC|nr:PREDICTED: G-type lectin S-receptor-like serine/threonine-protein kinase At4g27290 isoform X1 [Theobroma cacao]